MRANIYKVHAFCEDADGNRIASTETGFNIVGADEVKVLKNASAYLKEKYPAAVQVHFEGGASLVAANVIVSPEGEGPQGDEEGEDSTLDPSVKAKDAEPDNENSASAGEPAVTA